MVRVGSLQVAAELHEFLVAEALPGSGVAADDFWAGLSRAVDELGPRVRSALAQRQQLQAQIDEHHRDRPGQPDPSSYREFLERIGYLEAPPAAFSITTAEVDAEISTIAGPQLVVPVSNSRFAANAANARWGSYYDACYGTDVIDDSDDKAPGSAYNPARGAEVIRMGRDLLDLAVPLAGASHHDVRRYLVEDGSLVAEVESGACGLADPGQLVGHVGEPRTPVALLLVHHGLHLEIVIDRESVVGATDAAGVKDLILESATTTIMDLEDSVAAVDAVDKVACYRNWLHLMQGTLTAIVSKGGESFERRMNPDREYVGPDGSTVVLPGRSLLLVRHVGHLMTTESVLDANGQPISEGMLDAFVTALAACHDLRGNTQLPNTRAGSIYAVKPKQHGSHEVALTAEIFTAVEESLGLARNTIKLGLMDEERRTSLNLAACIHAARDRIAFINTGFLDRTGDEIHTSMHVGPMVRKADMRSTAWIAAYELANVETGLRCGLAGRAQIGKGMWAAPDNLRDMVEAKLEHPLAGASTAWVPSPTAATLHAVHYHQVDVAARQQQIQGQPDQGRLAELLTLPVAERPDWSREERLSELDNNVQSTLGYVVRWVDSGVGCSKVPDITGRALMEDRATCRISSQHVANWVLHGVVSSGDVEASLRRMALVVDEQNAADPAYVPMAPGFDGEAFLAARDLLLLGTEQPSGYTEPILHRRRRAAKEQARG